MNRSASQGLGFITPALFSCTDSLAGGLAAHPVEEHFLKRLVGGADQVTDAAPGHQVANFLGQVLGMIAGALQRLRHENQVKALMARLFLGIINVADEQQVAEAVHLGVGTKDGKRSLQVAIAKSGQRVSQHLLEQFGHALEIAAVLPANLTRDHGSAVGHVEQQVAHALEFENVFQAGEQLPGVGLGGARNCRGDALVNLAIELVQLFLAAANEIQRIGGETRAVISSRDARISLFWYTMR